MRPLIGISPMYDYAERKTYTKHGYQEGIIEAGGIPVIIPFTSDKTILCDFLNKLDGLILSGGADIDPKFFGQETYVSTGEVMPDRDEMEVYLAQLAIRLNKPILGICRGCQILNIAAGGDIYQDIYSEAKTKLKHVQDAPKWYPSHEITIEKGSIHEKLFGVNKMRVNSFHHQAVKKLGEGFKTVARTSDGIVEAIEHDACDFCVGVQYHPELMWEREKKFLKLFGELIGMGKNNL